MKPLKYSLFLIIIMFCNILHAEQNRHPKPEEMHEKKWGYLVTTSQLTEDEAKKVKPVFLEYEKAIWDLHKRNRNPHNKNENPDYKELNEKYIEREVKQAELLQAYHLKLRELLSPKTLNDYYRAENSFKRQLIYEMQQNHQKRRQNAHENEHK